ncbi:MAG: hypothetical protein FWD99_07110 [Oscillospiraceae bacterium]|nr:hypothetical protein [Oscillospiraceae bacterium]
MRKKISLFWGLCLILGLFSACIPTPSEELTALIEKFSALDDYTFTAEGELTFPAEFEAGAAHLPTRYVMEGRRAARTGQFAADIQYIDGIDTRLYDLSLLETSGATYTSFAPIFQYVLDHEFPDYYVLADAFDGNPYLVRPALDLSDLLVDIPALLREVSRLNVDEYLTAAGGFYAFSLTGEQAGREALTQMIRPFVLAADLTNLTTKEPETDGENAAEYEEDIDEDIADVEEPEAQETILDTLFTGPLSEYHLELTLTYDEENETYTVWLTLTTPNNITVTSDVTYKRTPVPPVLPPYGALEIAEIQEILSDYRAAQARARFLADSGLIIVHDLPELHMVDHQLSSSALESHEMVIDGSTYNVSILAAGDNTENVITGIVSSFAPAMSFLYICLDAFYASETMALFVLDAMDIEHFSGENHKHTPMRINAHDTAAAMALVYDDYFLDRTIHIYVLQAIADTDRALFLWIVIFPDMISNAERDALGDLGFYIGLDFLEYLALVPIEWDTEEEENA